MKNFRVHPTHWLISTQAHAGEDDRWRQRGRRGVSGGLVIVIILAVGTFVSCWLRHKRSVRLEAIRLAIKERPVGDGDIAAAAAMVAALDGVVQPDDLVPAPEGDGEWRPGDA